MSNKLDTQCPTMLLYVSEWQELVFSTPPLSLLFPHCHSDDNLHSFPSQHTYSYWVYTCLSPHHICDLEVSYT